MAMVAQAKMLTRPCLATYDPCMTYDQCMSHRASPLRTVIIALVLLFPQGARAEINVEKSVEWLCAQATIVARGTIIRIKDSSGPGKSRHLISMTFKVREALKGAAGQKLLYLSARHPKVKAFNKHLNKTELLLFLWRTKQGYGLDGHSYHLWPLRNQAGKQLLVDLASPGQAILSATRFKVLKDRRTILAACRQTLKRLARRGGARGRAAQRRLLEVPAHSTVHRALYRGSTCFLVVPGRLFPKARQRLR